MNAIWIYCPTTQSDNSMGLSTFFFMCLCSLGFKGGIRNTHLLLLLGQYTIPNWLRVSLARDMGELLLFPVINPLIFSMVALRTVGSQCKSFTSKDVQYISNSIRILSIFENNFQLLKRNSKFENIYQKSIRSLTLQSELVPTLNREHDWIALCRDLTGLILLHVQLNKCSWWHEITC